MEELRLEGGEVGDVPLEGVTTRGLALEAGGGVEACLSLRFKPNLNLELMRSIGGHRSGISKRRGERGKKKKKERKEKKREVGRGQSTRLNTSKTRVEQQLLVLGGVCRCVWYGNR